MIKLGSNKIRYISTGSTPALCMHIGNNCVYPYNGLYSSDSTNNPLFYRISFPAINTTTYLHVASPHLWESWGVTRVLSDGTNIDKESNTTPFIYSIPYIKPSRAGNVRWDCFIDYTNTTTNVYSFPMCSFYTTDIYYIPSSVSVTTVTFNLGSGVCKFTIEIPTVISTGYELSYPSILNFNMNGRYTWPVKINRTMFNATIY